MSQNIQDNRQSILHKLAILDTMLDSLAKVHEDEKDKIEDLTKKISTKKVILMDELLKILSPLG